MHGSAGYSGAVLREICSDRADVDAGSIAAADSPGAKSDSQLFAQFARHSGNALWIADLATGHFQYLNPAATRIWASESAGLSQWQERIHPHDLDDVTRQRARVAAGEAQRLSYRLCNGAVVRQFRETSFPIPADEEAGPRVAGIAEDVSADMPTYLIAGFQQESLAAEALRQARIRHKIFEPEEFLRVAGSLLGGCAIVDLNGLPDDHAHYLRALRTRASAHALILVGVPDATQAAIIAAMKAGAIDYLLHPPSADSIGSAVAAARIGRPLLQDMRLERQIATADRLSHLPRREHEVLTGLMGGGTNKSIGRTLGISPRTVEAHRAHLMDRLNVRTLTDLIQVAIAAGFQPVVAVATTDA